MKALSFGRYINRPESLRVVALIFLVTLTIVAVAVMVGKNLSFQEVSVISPLPTVIFSKEESLIKELTANKTTRQKLEVFSVMEQCTKIVDTCRGAILVLYGGGRQVSPSKSVFFQRVSGCSNCAWGEIGQDRLKEYLTDKWNFRVYDFVLPGDPKWDDVVLMHAKSISK